MRRFFLLLLGAAILAVSAPAQMKSGDQMNHYADVFGVALRQASYAYDIALIGSEPEANILAPGRQPVLTFLLTNHLDHPIRTAAKIDVMAYGTRGIPGDIWQSDIYKISDLPAVPIQVDLPAKGSQVIEIRPALPEAFGAYAFVADLGEAGRRFATSCVRAFAPDPAKVQYPRQALDDIGPAVLQGLGVKAIRMSFNYIPSTDKNYVAAMAKLDASLREYAARNITVLLMFLAGDGAPRPLGRGRPHLDGDGVMLRTKQDLAWLPESDGDFRKVVAGLGRKYGWPKGPVTAVELWNEPWEGISISGWGADSVRYREIFTAMAHGVEDARADGAQILIAGCDSTSNTLDKLFGDGSDTYLKWLDVCSIHYQGLCAPVLFKSWLDRKGPNGRVRIWDTESWVANTADRVAAVVAADRAAGYDRAMGVYGGNIATPFQKKILLPDGTSRDVSTYTAWPPAAAVAAAQHFMGEREFHGLLFRNGLPWVMVFDGLDRNPDDGTVVVVGDLHGQFGDLILFRDVTPAPGATMTVANPAGEFTLVDFYGNPVPASGKSLTVPLDDRGFFLRASAGAPGSFARLVQAVSTARIDGVAPLSVQAHDLLAPVGRKPSLRLSLTNVLNRPVQGAVTLALGDLALDAPKTLSFAPGETKEVSVPVTGGAARADNTYSLSLRFDAGADGAAALRENLHVNQIAHRTVQVDGDLDDWKGALPQAVKASGDQGPSLMEAAWLPFAKFDASQKSGFATAFLGYDDRNFYFAAKIADATPSPGTLRFATRDDDAYFYPGVSYEYDADKTLLQKEEAWSAPSRKEAALFLPGSKTERSFSMWSGVAGSFAVDLALPEGAFHKVSFYFVDPDEYQAGRRRVLVDVQDAATGKSLAQRVVSEYGAGTYVSFRAAGKVRVVFRTQSWLPASLSAVFLDPDKGGKGGAPAPASGAAAAWVASDLQAGPAWEGKYGSDGYRIAGAEPRLPSYAVVTLPEVAQKIEHRWPEGVRRYSYRKRPELPFGSAPKFDNVQIAFNVIPADQKPDTVPFPPGTMPGFVPAPDTDYEYALNPVAPEYGGGTEVWRSFVPGMVRKHFYPRQPASPFDGPVKDARLAFRQDGNTRIVECALPWSELPLVRKALDAGGTVKFSFRVNDDHGPSMELAQDRSVSRKNPNAFHPDWVEHWANQVEFSFEK